MARESVLLKEAAGWRGLELEGEVCGGKVRGWCASWAK